MTTRTLVFNPLLHVSGLEEQGPTLPVPIQTFMLLPLTLAETRDARHISLSLPFSLPSFLSHLCVVYSLLKKMYCGSSPEPKRAIAPPMHVHK